MPHGSVPFVKSPPRQTAAKYLDTLAEAGFISKQRAGASNYYVNMALVQLFLDVSGER